MVLIIVLYKVVLVAESLDDILKYHNSNKTKATESCFRAMFFIVPYQGHSTNNFSKMHCSIEYDKKNSCLRHFRVFFCIAGKKLSVPFPSNLFIVGFPASRIDFSYLPASNNKYCQLKEISK